jgi:hypothetical protein
MSLRILPFVPRQYVCEWSIYDTLPYPRQLTIRLRGSQKSHGGALPASLPDQLNRWRNAQSRPPIVRGR